MKKINKYIKRISILIILTNIPFVIFLPIYLKDSLGWIFGSLASLANFLWMAHIATQSINPNENDSKLKTAKGFYLRFLAIVVYAFAVVKFLKPNIIVFGLGLLATQFVIYLDKLYEIIKNKTKLN